VVLLRGLFVSGSGDWRGLAEVVVVDFKRFSLYSNKLFYRTALFFFSFIHYLMVLVLSKFFSIYLR